jgi:hypothetical protein
VVKSGELGEGDKKIVKWRDDKKEDDWRKKIKSIPI